MMCWVGQVNVLTHSQAVKLKPDQIKKLNRERSNYRDKIKEQELAAKALAAECSTKMDTSGVDQVAAAKSNRQEVSGKKPEKRKVKNVAEDSNTDGFDELVKERYKQAQEADDSGEKAMDTAEDADANEGSCSASTYGGAVWDIYRREDVPKLKEYILKHLAEFRHYNDKPIDIVCVILLSVLVCDMPLLVTLLRN